jgi:hypothetical protein
MDAARDALEPARTVIHRVHRRHHREQHLRGADVGGRLLAANVLLARLQREPVAPVPPCASTVTPTRRPGMLRFSSSRVAR